MKLKLIVGLTVVLSSVMLLNNLVFAQQASGFQKLNSDRASYLQFAYLPASYEEIAQEKDILFPSSQPIVVEAKRLKTVTEKLAVLADSLFEQNIRGLAKKKQDHFMASYLSAAAIELTEWLEDTDGNAEFQKLFKKQGPIYLVFLAMSPASMHEYMSGLDMPGLPTGVTEAKKLPVNMCVKKAGDNLIVEIWGVHDLSLTFKINAQNKVELIG